MITYDDNLTERSFRTKSILRKLPRKETINQKHRFFPFFFHIFSLLQYPKQFLIDCLEGHCMRELAFTERENGFEVSLQGCAFGMFFNSLQNLFIHIGLIGFSLLRRFIFFFLGCKNIASFSFLALEKEKHVVKSTYSYEIFEKFVKSKCQHNVLKIQFTKWP